MTSIRKQTLLAVLSVTGAILLAVTLWSYLVARHRLIADMKIIAQTHASATAGSIDKQLAILQGITHGLAIATATEGNSLSFATATQMQRNALQTDKNIFGISYAYTPSRAPSNWPSIAPAIYRDGTNVRYLDLATGNNAYTQADWFTIPRHINRPVWSPPHQRNNTLLVTYAVPFHSNTNIPNSVAGVISCDLSIEHLQAMLERLPLVDGGYAMILTRTGAFVAHPIQERVLNESIFSIAEAENAPELREAGRTIIAGQSGLLSSFRDTLHNDSKAWLAYTPMQSGNWILATIIPHQTVNTALARMTRHQLGIGILGMILLALAALALANSFTNPVIALRNAANQIAEGDMQAVLPSPKGKNELSDLTHAFNSMRSSILRHMDELRQSTASRERMQSELRIAHDIQMGLVPRTFPPFPSRDDLDLYATLVPAREVGGDFYDFFTLDEQHIVIAIGDVSGKGVPAALFMAVTRSFLRSAFRGITDMEKVMNNVNNDLVQGNDSCMFVTLFCAVLDVATGNLQYVNAGHNPPIIRRHNGTIEWVAEPKGTAAGVLPDAPYSHGELQLSANDLLLLYTDGVTEAMNPPKQLYGEQRLADFIQRDPYHHMTCQTVLDNLLSDIRHFAEGAIQSDDITMLMLRIGKADGNAPAFTTFITNQLAEANKALDEIATHLTQTDIPPKAQNAIRLAAEELLINTISYGYPDNQIGGHIEIMFSRMDDSSSVKLTIKDDAAPFDPNADAPAPDLDSTLDERTPGGLGIHMLKTMGMKIEYHRQAPYNLTEVIIPLNSTKH